MTLGLAVKRLNAVGIGLSRNEVINVEKAVKPRNEIQHFEFEVTVVEARNHYSQLFEFATAFHHDHLEGELHHHLEPDLWDREAELIEVFNREFIFYQGQSVIRDWPTRVRAAQAVTQLNLADGVYQRLKYGEEGYFAQEGGPRHSCHDCATVVGHYHVLSCDMEMCPRCGGQLVTCGCEYGEPDFDDLGD